MLTKVLKGLKLKFYGWEMNIKRVLVQKIKVKKSSFKFLTASFCHFFANCHITHKREHFPGARIFLTTCYNINPNLFLDPLKGLKFIFEIGKHPVQGIYLTENGKST